MCFTFSNHNFPTFKVVYFLHCTSFRNVKSKWNFQIYFWIYFFTFLLFADVHNKVTSWHFIIKKVFAPFLFSCKQNIDYEEKMHLLIHKTRDLKFYGTTASKNVLWCKNKCEHKFPLGKFISGRFFPVAKNILHKNTEKYVVYQTFASCTSWLFKIAHFQIETLGIETQIDRKRADLMSVDR